MLSHLSTGGTQEKSRGLSVSLSNTGNFIITVPVTQYHPFVLAPRASDKEQKGKGGGGGSGSGEVKKGKKRKGKIGENILLNLGNFMQPSDIS